MPVHFDELEEDKNRKPIKDSDYKDDGFSNIKILSSKEQSASSAVYNFHARK